MSILALRLDAVHAALMLSSTTQSGTVLRVGGTQDDGRRVGCGPGSPAVSVSEWLPLLLAPMSPPLPLLMLPSARGSLPSGMQHGRNSRSRRVKKSAALCRYGCQWCGWGSARRGPRVSDGLQPFIGPVGQGKGCILQRKGSERVSICATTASLKRTPMPRGPGCHLQNVARRKRMGGMVQLGWECGLSD